MTQTQAQNSTQNQNPIQYEEVFDRLRKIYEKFTQVSGGIEYIKKVIKFIDSGYCNFINYVGIYENCLGDYNVYLEVPTYLYGNVRVLLMTVDKESHFSIQDIIDMIREKYTEIINLLLTGLQDFLDDVIRKNEEEPEEEEDF